MKLAAAPAPSRTPPDPEVVAALAVVVAAACAGGGGDGTAVPAGDWSGDVAFPGEPDVAWGATWHVARSDSLSGPEISVTTVRLEQAGPVSLEARGDTLRFSLPFRPSADCEAMRRQDGSWRGGCPLPDRSRAFRVLLTPPGTEVPVGAARMALERVEGDWRRSEAGRVVVHTRPGTTAHQNLDRVIRHARTAVEHAVELLGADGWEGPVRLVYLESPDEMEQAVGRPVRGGWADAGANAALLVTYDDGASDVLHEVIHVVSMRRWGPAARPGMWLQEGLAEWGAGADCGDVPHGRLDRYLHERGDGLSVAELTGRFRQHSDRVTMPQATTLVGHLMDVHGLEAVRGLWDRGIGEAEAVLGYGSKELERRWRAWVEERHEPATEEEWDATIGSAQGCPREGPAGSIAGSPSARPPAG